MDIEAKKAADLAAARERVGLPDNGHDDWGVCFDDERFMPKPAQAAEAFATCLEPTCDGLAGEPNTTPAELRERLLDTQGDNAKLRSQVAALTTERDRLLKLFSDAGQGEHNVLALIDHYQGDARAEMQKRHELAAEFDAIHGAVCAERDALRARVRDLEEAPRTMLEALRSALSASGSWQFADLLAEVKAVKEVRVRLGKETGALRTRNAELESCVASVCAQTARLVKGGA